MSTATRTRRINIYINGKAVSNDIKSITAEFNRLRNETRLLNTDTKEYANNIARLNQLKSIINEHNQAINATKTSLLSLKGIANAFNKYWPMIMGFIGTVAGTVMGIRRATEVYAELDDKMADVMKTTGLTKEQVKNMNEEFKKINTRTAKNELLDLARIAGKLGITSEEEVMAFVRASDKIVVALKTDLGGSAEDAVNILGKLVQVFNLTEEFGIEQALLKTGSALNELGMASAASEQNIVSFTRRAAGIGKLSGIEIPKILGLAASVDALALSTEVASTAYIMFMGRMTKDTATFATIAGMKLEEFIELLNTDANEAMLRVLESLGKNEGRFASLAASMGDAGMDGQRAISVISTLAQQVDFIRKQQDLASVSFERGTSVIDEFNIKNETTQAIIEKQKKQIQTLREELGEKLLPVYMKGNNVFMATIQVIGKLTDFLSKHGLKLVTLVASIAAYHTVLKIGIALNKTWTASMIVGKTITLLSIAAYNKLRGNIIRANAAMKLLNATMKVNPWLILGSAIASVIAALVTYISLKTKLSEIEKINNQISKETSKRLIDESAGLERIFNAIKRYLPGTEERRKLLEELNAKYPGLLKNMNLEKAGLDEIEAAQRKATQALKNQIQLEVKHEELKNLRQKLDELRRKDVDPSELSVWERFLDLVSPFVQDKLTKGIRETTNQIEHLERSIHFDENKVAFGEQIANELDKIYHLEDLLQKIKQGKTVQLGKITLPANNASQAYIQQEIDLLRKRTDVAKAKLTLPNSEMPEPVTEEWFFKKRQELQEQFNNGRIKSYEEYENKLRQLEIDYMKEQLSRNNMNSEDRFKLETELFDKLHKQHGTKVKDLSLLDRWYYDEKNKLAQKYLENEITSEDTYNRLMNELEKEHYQRQLKDANITSDEKLKIQERLNNLLIKMKEQEMKMDEKIRATALINNPIEKERLEYKRRLDEHGFFLYQTEFKTQEAYDAFEALREQHQNNLDKIDADAIKDYFEKLNDGFSFELNQMKAKHTEEINAVGNNYKRRRELRAQHSQQEAKFIREHFQKLKALIDALKSNGAIDGIKLSDMFLSQEELEELDKILNELYEKIAKAKEKFDRDFGVATSNLLGFTTDQWAKFLENISDKWDEIGWKEKFETVAVGLLAISDATAQYFNLLAKYEDRNMQREQQANDEKKKLLAKRLEFGLISQENYNDQVAKMDKEMDRKKAILDRQQALREKNIAMFNATIQGAVAMIKVMDKPWLAALVGTMVAFQIGLISATPLPDIPGAEEGGQLIQRAQDGKRFNAKINPRKRGFINKPTVIVGENGEEYVTPAEAMKNPTIRPVLNALEIARLNNNLATVDFNDLLFSQIYNGRQSGGNMMQTTAIATVPANSTPAELLMLLKTNTQVLQQLNDKLRKPLKAAVSLYGSEGLYKSLEYDEIIKKNANL